METALVIEDNPNNMVLICDILELNGYSVIQAETGTSGFEIAKTHNPDFIILDIQLPDINGFNVLEKIRENAITENIPVIAMTSYAMAGDKAKFIAAGCDGYVEKPIEPGLVIKQIQKALKKSK